MHGPGRILSPIARVATAGSIALAAAFAGTGAVGAYPAPPPTASLTSSCASVSAGSSCSLTFTLVDSSNHPVANAPVNFSVSGLLLGSATQQATTNSSGVATGTFRENVMPLLGGSIDCGKVGNIFGSGGGAIAETQIIITCPSGGSGGLDLGQIFTTLLGSLITSVDGGDLTGSVGTATFHLAVPAGALPSGTKVNVLSGDTAKLATLVPAGTRLLSAFSIEWPAGLNSSAPVTFTLHNSAFSTGQSVDEAVGGKLVPYGNSTVGDGVATVTFAADPAFAVLAPTTAVPAGLGNEGAAPAVAVTPSQPTGMLATAAAAILLLTLLAIPVLRRRLSA